MCFTCQLNYWISFNKEASQWTFQDRHFILLVSMKATRCKHTKQAVVRPTKVYINRVAQYIPHRMKSSNNFRAQLFGEKETSAQKIFTNDPCVMKMEQNINTIMEKTNDAQLLPLTATDRGLVNPFRNIKANSAQSHDLLNFHSIGWNQGKFSGS